MTKTTKKVFGFVFEDTLEHVILGSYKNGLNGISTKVRKDELALDAMKRAATEKVESSNSLQWKHYATIIRETSVDYYYWAVTKALHPKAESGMNIVDPRFMKLDSNAKWLIPLAEKEILGGTSPFILLEKNDETQTM